MEHAEYNTVYIGSQAFTESGKFTENNCENEFIYLLSHLL